MYRHLLVPTDGSDLSIETVGKAVAFAKALGARITFFTARADYGATDHGALERSLEPAAFSEHAAGDARGFLAQAVAAARAESVACQTCARTNDHPYEGIIEAADEFDCDLIFMASHGRRGFRSLILGSQTQKVLAHSRIPVLVSSTETNQVAPAMSRATATIRREHRSLAAVTHGLLYLVDEVSAGRQKPDVELLTAMLAYITHFPERLHHPKEERYLFARLRQRTQETDSTLAQLVQQHHQETEHVAALESSLAGLRDTGSFQPFADAVKAFATALWAHMSLEEKVILPAAMTHLHEEDWRIIAEAFDANGDPRFEADVENSYKALFARLMNLAPSAEFIAGKK